MPGDPTCHAEAAHSERAQLFDAFQDACRQCLHREPGRAPKIMLRKSPDGRQILEHEVLGERVVLGPPEAT